MTHTTFTQHGTRVYNKANCHNKERKDFTSPYGDHIGLIGIHAHEYTLIEHRHDKIRMTTYACRKAAETAYKLACKK